MGKALPVFFCKEITLEDTEYLIKWLKKEQIREFLNEDYNVIDSIKGLINNNCQTMLTYHFNKGGRFYLINEGNAPIGFVNLIDKYNANEYEIVIVIGEEQLWGKGYGKSAVKQCLNLVFFEWRAKKLTAKIHHKNYRSLHLFKKVGFSEKSVKNNMYIYQITFEDYLNAILNKN